MKRSMMQMYVNGSAEAVGLYQKAFNAELVSAFKNNDGSYYHAELNACGQILAIAEASYAGSFAHEERVAGNTMQFCFHFGEGKAEIVKKAFDTLKEGSNVLFPSGPCEYSPYMVDFIDKFGIRWCLFV